MWSFGQYTASGRLLWVIWRKLTVGYREHAVVWLMFLTRYHIQTQRHRFDDKHEIINLTRAKKIEQDQFYGPGDTFQESPVTKMSFIPMRIEPQQSKTKQLLQWRHNERDGVSNHQHHDCLLNRLFRRRSKKTSKLRVTGLCAGNSPVTGEFPAQRASNAENVSIWWHHHETMCIY